MNNLAVVNRNGQLLVDSREVADMTLVRHADLLEKIKAYIQYLENGLFRSQDFFIPSSYKADGNNKTYECYLLTRKGCDMVANKMTGEKGVLFTAVYVTQFEQMERELQLANAPSYMIEDPILRAKRWIQELEDKQKVESAKLLLELTVEESKPKVQFYDIYQRADVADLEMEQAAKSLGIGVKTFYSFLRWGKVFYKSAKKNLPQERYVKSGYFVTTPYTYTAYMKDGTAFDKNDTKVYVTPKGLERLGKYYDGYYPKYKEETAKSKF